MPPARRIIFAVVSLFLLTSGSTDGQIRRHPDDAIRVGTRIAPLPPGEGGQLIVSAPADMCRDGGHLLDISYSPAPGFGPGTVIHIPAGPSSCVWTFDGLAAGAYWGAIEHQPDGNIVATARGQVMRGATEVISLRMVETEVEGFLTVNGLAPPNGIRLMFGPTSRPGLAWQAPFDPDGAYRVTLDPSSDEMTCAKIERALPLNASAPKCAKFAPGLQRFDLDFTMPPGVIGIDVMPIEAGFGNFGRITINDSRDDDPERGWLTSFKFVRGLQGEYLAEIGREYNIRVTDERKMLVGSARVILSSEQPVARVTLNPYRRMP